MGTEGPTEGPTDGPTQGPAECPTSYVGDNYCDDQCNNEENDFDGGDCCGDDVNEQYCSVCECLEGGTTEGPTEGPSDCIDQWIGDDYCDDENNNAACGFDGGDCCQENPIDGWDQYCSDCLCLEMPETTEGPDGSNCELPHWFGDSYCDDENNNAACGFDGGDCCGDDVNTTY